MKYVYMPLAIMLVIFSAILTMYMTSFKISELLSSFKMMDTYFDADVARIFQEWTSLQGEHHRTSVHPITPFTITILTVLTEFFSGADANHVAIIVVSIASIANAAMIFLFAYGVTRSILLGLLCALLLITSASFMHWAAIPESFPIGAVFMSAMILASIGVLSKNYLFNIAMNVFSFGMTVTNIVHSAIFSFIGLSFFNFIKVVLISVLAVTVVNIIQWLILEDASVIFFLKIWHIMWEIQFTPIGGHEAMADYVWTPFSNLRGILVSSIVAPNPEVVEHVILGEVRKSVENRAVGELAYSAIGIFSVMIWLGLAVISAWGMWLNRTRYRAAVVLITAGIAWQAILHSVYGVHAFLYTMHVLPFLAALTVFAMMTPWRRVAVVLTLLLIVVGGMHNLSQFDVAHDAILEIAAEKGL